MAQDLRALINIIEAAQEWGISQSPIFADSLAEHLRVFPDLKDKLAKFVSVKLPNPVSPNARYGKHDAPMTGPLVGFWHCHLRDDAVLIYNLDNRCVHLICIVSHAEIEGKRARATRKKLSSFKT